MKSHFSRFLHITSSYSGLPRISRWNKFASLFDLDTPIKSECDSLCAGRSMVEMLGVLAIIGVLSVGAIAGYSKAMMKHKLNQHAVAVNMLINNVLSIKDKLQYNKNSETYYGFLLYKMNLLPDGIKYINNASLHDNWFNNRIIVYYSNVKYTTSNGTEAQNDFGGIGFYFAPSSGGAEICRNIVIAAKENAANLWFVQTYKSFNDTSSANGTYIGHLYGDAYCSASNECLRDLDLNKVSNLCNACNERACTLYVLWK